MITVRRARPADAASIGAVHVAAWRSAYPGILPSDYLSNLSAPRQAAYYDLAIRSPGRVSVHVAAASGADLGQRGGTSRVVGFVTSARARPPFASLADGEIETLYVLDDFRERGLGRRLLRAAAVDLAQQGCRSAFLWVLRDNPSRWFYARLGGRPVAEDVIRVAGAEVAQTAYLWNPIDTLARATSAAS